jgi:hypothetical protein
MAPTPKPLAMAIQSMIPEHFRSSSARDCAREANSRDPRYTKEEFSSSMSILFAYEPVRGRT